MKTPLDRDSGKKSQREKPKAIIKESIEDQRNQNSGTMLNQKTYEDYNKEQPNPADPNQNLVGKKTETKDQGIQYQKIINTKMKKATTYTCSMHPEVKSDKPGKCPKCKMELIEKK